MTRAWALLALAACGAAGDEADTPAPALANEFEVVRADPDPEVVTDAALRERLEATGLPWCVRERTTGIELLLVPPGTALRGAAEGDAEASADERPAHEVVVHDPFYLGRHEVTQAEWGRVMPVAPSFFRSEDASASALPVESVDVLRAAEFASLAGLALPTESQWEYACRLGSEGSRHGPLDDVAWHGGRRGGNAERRTHPVGGKAATPLGFHDMLGNVWEWTSSGFVEGEYELARPPVDARARMHLAPRAILRGGSWYDPERRSRATARYAVERDFKAAHVGLRVMVDASEVVASPD